MADEQQRTDEPTDDEREETLSDLDVPEEGAEDVKGGAAGEAGIRKL
jgi:hypothetical protein